MAHFLCLLIAFFLFNSSVHAEPLPVGAVDLAGWVKGADGTYSRAFADGSGTRANPTNTTVTSIQNAQVQTSKGLQDIEIQRQATVNTARIGAAVANFAKKVGPVGMAIGTASLVCELTTICDQAGQWMMGADPAFEGFPATSPNYRWGGYGGQFPDPQTACNASVKAQYLGITSANPVPYNGQVDYYDCQYKNQNNYPISGYTGRSAGCADNYLLIGSECVLQGNSQPRVPTSADWDAKAPLLNDDRFTPELTDKGVDVPTGIPTLTPGQKKDLGLESKPTKDAQGNITGREDTVTTLEPLDAATADAPGRVIFKETTTNIKYDTNNTQISTTTSTSYSASPSPDRPPTQYEIKFDGVDPVELPTYNVPNTYASTSWGSGTCPPDIDLNLNLGHFVIPTAPVCDTAEKLNPFVLALSALFSIYIVAGVKASNS